MSDSLKIAEYRVLLTELKTRIHAAQYAALRAVNKELLALYWDIGKLIEDRQESEGWGKAVVERLSADLRTEFGEKSGFSVQNLWYMRKFYREYKEVPNLQPLAGEIAWTKNTLILDRCQNPLQREFYLRATARFGWTRRVLEHQIDNQTYEKYLLNQTSFDSALPQALPRKPSWPSKTTTPSTSSNSPTPMKSASLKPHCWRMSSASSPKWGRISPLSAANTDSLSKATTNTSTCCSTPVH